MAGTLDLLHDISDCLDQLLAADPLDDPDEVASQALIEAMDLGAKLDAVCARLGSRVDTSGAWREDGSKSASAWLGRHSRRHGRDCQATIRRGRHLRALPTIAAAFEAGTIGAWHLDQIGKLHKRYPDQVVHDQDWFVEWAATLDHDQFVQAITYWRHAVDPDGIEHDATSLHDRRRLDLSDGIDGCGLIDANFEPIGWATFREALHRIEHEMWEHDWAEARARLGDAATKTDLGRTDTQRRYDALIEMALRATAAPADGKRPRPLVTVHVDHDTLAGRITHLSTGTIVTPGQILPLLLDCDIERAVFDGPSRIIELGRTRRLFVAGTRRAVEILKPTCAHPGCTEPSEHCQIDHRQPWEQGGRTDPDNGQPLCPPHHRHKTERQQRDARQQRRRRRRPATGHDDEPG